MAYLIHMFAQISRGPIGHFSNWDLLIIILFLIAAFAYGLSLGRDRVIVVLVSIYMSLGIVAYAPFLQNLDAINLGMREFFFIKLSSFIGLFLILFIVLSRVALLRTIATSNHSGTWWQVLIFSVLQVGLLIAVLLSYFPSATSQYISPLIRMIFVDEIPRFFWVIAPIIAMMFLGKNHSAGAFSE